ncbi:MAG: exonuclease domain-containing protein [Candidatus Dojkabacteria bacterium]|jgi:exodeoxyribonuclease X
MDEKFLFFDTETTDVQSKDLIQLALTNGNDITLNKYFKPLQKISFSAMAVHHITPEFLSDTELFEKAVVEEQGKDKEFKGNSLKEYLKFLAEKYIWVAHNAEFDLEVLAKKGITIPKYICTYKLARNMIEDEATGGDIESYSLQYLRYYLGLYKKENQEHTIAHDAMSDVCFLKDLFKYIQENSKFTVEQMLMISKEPAYIRNISFGKYAGKTLEDIAKLDREYLEWLKETVSDKPDLVWNIERVLSIDNISGGLFGRDWI